MPRSLRVSLRRGVYHGKSRGNVSALARHQRPGDAARALAQRGTREHGMAARRGVAWQPWLCGSGGKAANNMVNDVKMAL